MFLRNNGRSRLRDVDLSVASWFLFASVLWELLFNRLAWSVRLYAGVGAEGPLSLLAMSGRFAMASSGIMAMVLICAGLPRIAGDPRFGPLPLRVILTLASPFYLPVICVSIFRPVSTELVMYAYISIVGSAAFLCAMIASRNLDSTKKRLVIALGAVQIMAAAERMFAYAGASEEVLRNSYLFSEVLLLVTPIFGFFILKPGGLLEFVKRPHTLGLFFACTCACIATLISVIMPSKGLLQTIAYRTLGMTMPLPWSTPFYIISLFLGTLIVGTLMLPSRRWPPTDHSRRMGLGLLAIWTTGIQPDKPYQFALAFLGFIYLGRGLIGQLDKLPKKQETLQKAPLQH